MMTLEPFKPFWIAAATFRAALGLLKILFPLPDESSKHIFEHLNGLNRTIQVAMFDLLCSQRNRFCGFGANISAPELQPDILKQSAQLAESLQIEVYTLGFICVGRASNE